jgi:beta-glucosidase/6-phospho-beta-glucosidase/beta-galactosidase
MSGRSRRIEFIGGFESSYMPAFDVDVAETTDHIAQRAHDLTLLRSCGVRRTRYPVRWHRLARDPDRFDWAETDAVMEHLRAHNIRPIVDLVHHTSYPLWLTEGFADPKFPAAYLRFVEAFVTRYPTVDAYTPFNEPFSTLFLCAGEGVWPPYHRGIDSFVQILRNALPAIAAGARLLADALPRAEHVHVDACERHTGDPSGPGAEYAAYANDRRFFVLDALLGRIDRAEGRAFVEEVVRCGGADLLELEPMDVDVVGLDYYAHCQWHFGEAGATTPTRCPPPFADVIREYADRYRRPVMVTETNVRGFASDRATWLKYTLEQCENAVAAGVDLRGYCWFPFVDSCDWSSLLSRHEGAIDPVGVYGVTPDRERRPSSMSAAYRAAASGTPASMLPAYVLQEPVATWLGGYREQMAHWQWVDPPPLEITGADEAPIRENYDPLIVAEDA